MKFNIKEYRAAQKIREEQFEHLKSLKEQADDKVHLSNDYFKKEQQKLKSARRFKNPEGTLQSAKKFKAQANVASSEAMKLYGKCFELIKSMGYPDSEIHLDFYFSLFKNYALFCAKSNDRQVILHACHAIENAQSLLYKHSEKFSRVEMLDRLHSLEKIRSALQYVPLTRVVEPTPYNELIQMNSRVFHTYSRDPAITDNLEDLMEEVEDDEEYKKPNTRKRKREDEVDVGSESEDKKRKEQTENQTESFPLITKLPPSMKLHEKVTTTISQLGLISQITADELENQQTYETDPELVRMPIQIVGAE